MIGVFRMTLQTHDGRLQVVKKWRLKLSQVVSNDVSSFDVSQNEHPRPYASLDQLSTLNPQTQFKTMSSATATAPPASSTRSRRAQLQSDGANPDLPPKRETHGLVNVKPPLFDVSLSSIIYAISIGAVVMGAYYTFRMLQLAGQSGGSANVLMGRSPEANAPGVADL